jgi:hypothetical protein
MGGSPLEPVSYRRREDLMFPMSIAIFGLGILILVVALVPQGALVDTTEGPDLDDD